jgi:hypothetical protein
LCTRFRKLRVYFAKRLHVRCFSAILARCAPVLAPVAAVRSRLSGEAVQEIGVLLAHY